MRLPTATRAAALILSLAGGVAAHGAPAPQPGSFWTIQGENDKVSTLPGGSDRYYTSGLRIGWTSGTGAVPAMVDRAARAVWGDGTIRIGVSISQQIYTPADTGRVVPDPRDRPLAGYLAGSFAVLHDTGSHRTLAALTVGVIGPSALGRTVQNGFHELIRVPINRGWGAQLPDEPQLQLRAERTWRLPLARAGGIEADALPSLTAGAGTVRDYVQAAVLLRVGQGLGRDFGVARLSPGISGGDAFDPSPGLAWYVFAGFGGQAVARDALLDGALWHRSAHVGRNVLLGSVETGLAVIWHGVRFSYTQTWQTQSFRGQKSGLFNFGSLAATVHF